VSCQPEKIDFDDQHTSAAFTVDKKVYSKSAILRTCYWFEKDLWFQIEDKDEHFWLTVKLRAPVPTLDNPKIRKIDCWIPDIFNSLVDSQLRVEIQTETSGIRELIIAKAFAESGVLEDSPPGKFEDHAGSSLKETKGLISISINHPD